MGGFGRIAAAVVVLLILVVACSSGGDDSDSAGDDADVPSATAFPQGLAGESDGEQEPTDSGTDDADRDTADEGAAGEESSGGDGAGTGAEPVVFDIADLGRSIIYTAMLDLQVDDVTAASREAQQEIAAVGGLVFSQETITAPQARTTLVFKVPPADFGEAMTRLEGIGRVISQDISADDVTDRVVDLQSRIATSEISVERLRGLLDGANSVEAIAALEGQLLERETNLELLRGQLRTIEGQVSLATITVSISEEGAEAAINVSVTAYDGEDEGARCPGERRLDVDEGESVIVCVTIENVGNVDVGDIEVRDLGLDLRREDFTLADFGDDDVIEPGDEVIAWAQIDAEPGQWPNPSVTVVALDDDNEVIRQATSMTQEDVMFDVIEDDSLPGPTEALSIGWGALTWVLAAIVLVVGVAAPLMLIAVPVIVAVIWWRRWRLQDDAQVEEPEPVQ